ncbi:MAG: hypothetical protein IH943_04715 [Acidobacteria bacterium]|nr:hypothetical protein [Acidobacteriota bacterium]
MFVSDARTVVRSGLGHFVENSVLRLGFSVPGCLFVFADDIAERIADLGSRIINTTRVWRR